MAEALRPRSVSARTEAGQARYWRSLGLAIVLPFFVWAAHFVFVYVVTALVCAERADLALRGWVLAGTLAALAWLGWFGLRHRRALPGGTQLEHVLHAAAVLSVVLAAISTLMVAAPAFALRSPCFGQEQANLPRRAALEAAPHGCTQGGAGRPAAARAAAVRAAGATGAARPPAPSHGAV